MHPKRHPSEPEEAGGLAHSTLPWWVNLLDVLGAGLAALAGVVFVTGGFRFESDALLLSVTSWQRLTLWSFAVLALRHLLVRRPSTVDRLSRFRLRMIARHQTAIDVVAIGAGSRLAVLLAGYLAVVVLLTEFEDSPFGAALGDFRPAIDSEAWDHLRVARQGYSPGGPRGGAVFPAVGLLIRFAGWLLALPPLVAGIAISVAAFAGAMIYLYRLGRLELGRAETLASMALLAAYPWAVAHSLVTPDALYLLAAVGSFYHLRRGHVLWAAAWGALLGLSRPGGFLMAVPLGLAAWKPAAARGEDSPAPVPRDVPTMPFRRAALLAAAAPLAGLAAGLLYAGGWAQLFGAVPAGRLWGPAGLLDSAGPLWQLASRGLLRTAGAGPFAVLDAMSAVLAVSLVWPVTRRFGIAWGLFVALNLAASLLFAGEPSPGRQAAVLFPLFLWMGSTLPEGHRFGWLALFALLQALLAVLFFTTGAHWL